MYEAIALTLAAIWMLSGITVETRYPYGGPYSRAATFALWGLYPILFFFRCIDIGWKWLFETPKR